MICANCGTQNEAGRRFCDECGAALAVGCPQCGESNRPSAKFCGNCGATLGGDAPATRAPVSTTAPSASAAERRLVSVLFVDLVGFTPFAEERDPEAVRETLDRYFGIARLAVERHGGTIEKFIGDAVMAVWGTPTAHEDDAERSVRAALELVDGVKELGSGIDARAGVMTGEAAVTIGADGQGMVAGDMVNTASRLQSVAAPGTVLVNETTMHAASAAIAFEAVGSQTLKGKAAPVEAYRALRVVAQRGGQNRSEALEAPFVGRDEELRQLKELLHATTRDPRARLVSITGPAGIGKSRLAWELEKYLDGVVETVYWHRGRSPSYGEGVTFWALGEMVRRRANLAETDDEATTRQRVAATVTEFVADPDERGWVEPALLALLGIEPPPAGGRDALFAAWRIFFERIAESATTALVFEDLQWADSGLLDFIEHLLEWSKNRPLLVITLSRPELYERRPSWGAGHRLMTSISLEPLTEPAMRQLLAGLVPGLPEEAVQTILRRADGIPLYAVETVRMLVNEGRLEAVDGSYRPRGEMGDLAVPETLRSLIASRLDALEAADRGLLQDGAVIGQRFTVPALAAISGLPVDEIEGRLRGLVRREFLELEVDPRSPECGQYGFVQSLIREVAYGTLAHRERRSRHLAAARYFETLDDEELAGVLASHYLAAHEASTPGPEADALAVQARIALRAAGERAAALGGHEQALHHFEQALAVSTEPTERAALLELAADSANATGRSEVAAGHARQATQVYRETGNEQAAARSAALLGRILIDGGRLKAAIEEMEAALAAIKDPADEVIASDLLANLSRAFMRSDQPGPSIEMADRALTVAERRNMERVVAEAMINKGSSLQTLSGRRREAAALLETAVGLAHESGWSEMELRGRNNLSVAVAEDDPRRALDIVLGGIALARRVGQRGIVNWQSGTSGMYSYVLGDGWDAALTLLDETVASAGLTASDKVRAITVSGVLRACRGEHVDDSVLDPDKSAAGESDPQTLDTAEHMRAIVALLGGRFDEAFSLASHSILGWRDFTPVHVPTAALAAFYAGRLDHAREAARLLNEFSSGGRWVVGLRAWATAGCEALEGNTAEAVKGLKGAIDELRAAEFHWFEALAILSAIRLLPGEPEVGGWAPAARAIFERVGAAPFIALLDKAVSDAAESAPRSGARTPAAKSAEVPAA